MNPKLLGILTGVALAVVLFWMGANPKRSNDFSIRDYRLKVVNVTFKELLLFEDALQKRIPSAQKVNRQRFDSTAQIAEIEVTIIGDSQQFVKELALIPFDDFEVEVLNQTPQSLDIQINQK